MRPGAALLRDRIDAVVVGGSAGSVEVLSELLPHLPASCRVPVLIVLHLPRNAPSLLEKIFAPRCVLPVREAEDKEPVRPGTVYFAPTDYHLLVDVGPSLALSVDEPVLYSRPAIDVLFESAAEQYGSRLMGILLTGASQDGARGLEAIRRSGGVTVVQEPASALYPVMPAAALARGEVDEVLAPEQLGALLQSLG